MNTNHSREGIINLTINNMDRNILPSPAPAPATATDPIPFSPQSSEGNIPGMELQQSENSGSSLTQGLNTSMVVEAEEVNLGKIICNKIDGIVSLSYIINDEEYSKKITKSNNDFWENNKSIFQNDFNKFYRILKNTFEDNNENTFLWSIIQKNNDRVLIEITNTNSFFEYKTTIELKRKDSEVNILRKRLFILEKENEKMNEDIIKLKKIILAICMEEDQQINIWNSFISEILE